jgi:hypothetical protein
MEALNADPYPEAPAAPAGGARTGSSTGPRKAHAPASHVTARAHPPVSTGDCWSNSIRTADGRVSPVPGVASQGMKRRRRGRIVRVGKSTRRVAYRAYMQSPQWRKFRIAWLNTYDAKYKIRRCYVCGVAQAEWPRPFDLHHRTYERLGNESYADLVLVCSGRGGCHPKITRAWRGRHKTGLTMSLWQLTEHYRERAKVGIRAVPDIPRRSPDVPSPVVTPVRRSTGRTAASRAG